MSIEKAAFAFSLDGTPISCEPFGHGHINNTFKICTDTGAEYVLQRINKYVFKNPVWVICSRRFLTPGWFCTSSLPPPASTITRMKKANSGG